MPDDLGPLARRTDEVLVRLHADLADADVRARVADLRTALAEPLRVAVAGRVKAGKSTLVNALLRQRVAPTDVGECTRLVTWYRFGVPERLEIVLRSGARERRALRADGSLPPELGVDLLEVDHLEVYLSIDDLRSLTIIDTPGLQSANDDHSRRTRELLAIDEASRRGVTAADVLVLVMALEPRQGDVDTLAAFDAQFTGLHRNALNAVGVLSRIDHLGVGPSEVEDRAEEIAARFSDHHRLSLAAVVPVNGLLAEATRCGVLTERDEAVLGAIQALPAAHRRLLLLSADRFVEMDVPVPRADRARLLGVLDLFGVERSLELIDQHGRGGAALERHLRATSRIDRLADEVFDHFGRRADAVKVGGVVAGLGRLGGSDPDDRARITGALEELALDPDLLVVQLVRAAQRVGAGEVHLPADLAADLLATVDGRIGPAGAEPVIDDSSVDVAIAAIGRWRRFANDGRAGPAEREVADVVIRIREAAL